MDTMLVLAWNDVMHILHYITLSLFHMPFTPKVTSGASTKLCICQCKQMSFQLPFESTCISKFLESKRKIIPCFRPGIGEASLTELALHYWNFISESVRRSESSSAGQISSCRYNVRQVGRSTANMHQMHKYAQFERYAKLNWEPVQTPKRWSDVLSYSSASDESGGCILDFVFFFVFWGLHSAFCVLSSTCRYKIELNEWSNRSYGARHRHDSIQEQKTSFLIPDICRLAWYEPVLSRFCKTESCFVFWDFEARKDIGNLGNCIFILSLLEDLIYQSIQARLGMGGLLNLQQTRHFSTIIYGITISILQDQVISSHIFSQ